MTVCTVLYQQLNNICMSLKACLMQRCILILNEIELQYRLINSVVFHENKVCIPHPKHLHVHHNPIVL